MEIHNFNYIFLESKIDEYFSHKFGKLIQSSNYRTFKEFVDKCFGDVSKLETEYKPLLYKLYCQLKINSEKYGIFITIDFQKWSRLIEYLAYKRNDLVNKNFESVIEEIADLHYKCLREDKLRVTGWL